MQPEKIIVDILQNRMALPADYGEASNSNIIPSIMIGSQNALLGATDKLQIVVYSLSEKVIAHNRYEDDLFGGGYQERIEQIIFSTMQVDIQSRDNSARDRRTEVLAALHSTYAEQKQEENGCRIFAIPEGFINTGNRQGGSSLNRWTIRFKMTYKQTHTLGIDYYDKFKAELNTENSQDMIEYNY